VTGVLITIGVFALLFGGVKLLALRDNPGLFRPAVRAYAKRDALDAVSTCDNVFTGSSVMKYWRTLESDLAPAPALNRAIPGTKIGEIAVLAPDLVARYHPRRVFLYAGSNDIQGLFPRSAAQVLAGFDEFVAAVRADDPRVEVFFISILPSPARTRMRNIGIISSANALIRTRCEAGHGLHFIDLVGDFVDESGAPRADLFRADRIHLRDESYAAWGRTISALLAVVGEPEGLEAAWNR
jgi:lysophospholipase L1-like esterase